MIVNYKKIISIKNGKAEIVKFGKGNKNLVILPGLSYDGFFAQADEIERSYELFSLEYTVYLIDRNLTPKAGYTVRDMAEDVAEVLNKLGVKNADILGVSLGGMVAATLAVEFPILVNKLVLGSTLIRPNETSIKVLNRWEKIAKSGDIARLFSDMFKTIYSPCIFKKYSSVFLDAANSTEINDDKTARFITYLNAGKSYDLYSSVLKIKAETFVICAKNDRVTTALGAREISEKLKCEYFEYKKYGHAVYDEAKGYKKRVYDFLTE